MMIGSLLMIPVQGSRLAGSRTVRRKHAFARPEKYATGALVVAWKIGRYAVSISFCVLHSELVFFLLHFLFPSIFQAKVTRKHLILSLSSSSFSDIFSSKNPILMRMQRKADHYADVSPFPEQSKCWFSTSPRHCPSWLMLRWIGFSCSSCQCISSPGHLQIHFVVFPHIFLNFQIIKGPSIYNVIKI